MVRIAKTDVNVFIESFHSHCGKNPDRCALVHDGVSVSYAQLDALSDAFVAQIVNAELDVEHSVALLCARSVQAIAVMLGCLKFGIPFVPIDTEFPDERIRYMLTDANVGMVLSDAASHARAVDIVSDSSVKLLRVEHVSKACHDNAHATHALTEAHELTRAYIMYTSGSTGKPKGVPISNAALMCYCRADAQVYRLSSSDRTLQFATLSFDISIEEIFPPLSTGGTVVLRPSRRSDAQIELSDIIQRFSITAVHLATGYWHEWVDIMSATGVSVPEKLRLMVVTGEKVSPEHYVRWSRLCQHSVLWANAYGPTETTVSATVFIPPEKWSGNTLPIGTALPGYRAYILDDQLRAVKSGQTGELFIGGGALAEGYLNQPELTRKAFINVPIANIPDEKPESHDEKNGTPRLYRTGDLARWLSDGNIEYAGRIDYQLKIGSYRIEPGEIENAINESMGVQDSLVSVASDGGRKYLVAYVAHSQEMQATTEFAHAIKTSLDERLPAYMVPIHYVLMSHMPKTLNGKIDRKALPSASEAIVARFVDAEVASTDIENALCDIWCQILSFSSVGIHDSFLSLGGDSLMAVRVIAQIQQKLNFVVSTRDFFYLDTIALLAAHIEGRQVPRLVPPADTFFINRQRRQTYTVLQSPIAANGRGVLVVPSLGNEQRRCQRPVRSMMQTLARDGYHLLRFDWQGTANSSGNASELRDLQPWLDDLQEAALKLSESVDEIHMVSIRLGALISALPTLDDLPIAASYCWDPVNNGQQWLEQMRALQRGIRADTYSFLFKRGPRSDELHEFAGLTIHPELYQTIESLDLTTLLNERTSTFPVHLMMSSEVQYEGKFPVGVSVQTSCEFNDWIDSRATTHDMKINSVANSTVALMRSGQDRQ